jgi:hypothetical protein
MSLIRHRECAGVTEMLLAHRSYFFLESPKNPLHEFSCCPYKMGGAAIPNDKSEN